MDSSRSSHVRVLIAATVAAVLGPGARILGIAEWTRQGRAVEQRSHQPRRNQGGVRSLARTDPGAKRR